jgi:predicted SnoaL-like aldol condensation-catalyzing enzyme
LSQNDLAFFNKSLTQFGVDNSNNNIKADAKHFLQLTATGNVNEAFYLYVSPEFRHHNMHFKGDATSLKEAMNESAVNLPGKELEIKLAICEANMVAVYSKVTISPGGPGIALVHFFRFEDSKIVELWDLAQAPLDEMINENGLF